MRTAATAGILLVLLLVLPLPRGEGEGDDRLVASLKGHQGAVVRLQFLKSRQLLLSSAMDHVVRLWSMATWKETAALEHPRSFSESCIAVSADERLLAVGAYDGSVSLRSLEQNGAELRVIPAEDKSVYAVAFSPDGRLLATAGESGAKLWTVETGACVQTLAGHAGWVTAIAFSPDGNLIATGSEDRTARLWSVADGKPLAVLGGHRQGVGRLDFFADGTELVTGDNQSATVWRVEGGERIATILPAEAGAGLSYALSPKEALIASAEEGDDLRAAYLRSLPDGKVVATLGAARTGFRDVGAFSRDGRLFAMIEEEVDTHSVDVWDVGAKKKLRTFSDHADRIFSATFSDDGHLLASGSRDGVILVRRAD